MLSRYFFHLKFTAMPKTEVWFQDDLDILFATTQPELVAKKKEAEDLYIQKLRNAGFQKLKPKFDWDDPVGSVIHVKATYDGDDPETAGIRSPIKPPPPPPPKPTL